MFDALSVPKGKFELQHVELDALCAPAKTILNEIAQATSLGLSAFDKLRLNGTFGPVGTPAAEDHGLADPSRDGSTVPANWQPVTDKVTLAVLGKAIEEAGELVCILSRIVIQGSNGCDPKTGKANLDALFEELADNMATAKHLTELFGRQPSYKRATAKFNHKAEWHRMLKEG